MLSDAFWGEISAFASVVVIDLVLAGDNAIIVGMAAAGLPPRQRRLVIAIGIGLAVLFRIAFAVVAVQLLAIIGLVLAGGLLLLWVAWKMWRELREGATVDPDLAPDSSCAPRAPAKKPGTAIWQIAIADLSMSLDNVLAVAGAARDHMAMLIFGLVLSVALMGAAATIIARFMARHHWLAYLGLVIVTFVAVSMIVEGAGEILTVIENSALI